MKLSEHAPMQYSIVNLGCSFWPGLIYNNKDDAFAMKLILERVAILFVY